VKLVARRFFVTSGSKATHRWRIIVRRIGLALGTLAGSFWAFIVIVSLFQGVQDLDLESGILTVLIVAGIGATIQAWRDAFAGSFALMGVGAAFMIFAWFSAGHNKGFAMIISGGPFLLSGLLIWFSTSYQSKISKKSDFT
jgi:hypothetical protein